MKLEKLKKLLGELNTKKIGQKVTILPKLHWLITQATLEFGQLIDPANPENAPVWKTEDPVEGDYICRMKNGYIKMCHYTGQKWLDMWEKTIESEVMEYMEIPS